MAANFSSGENLQGTQGPLERPAFQLHIRRLVVVFSLGGRGAGGGVPVWIPSEDNPAGPPSRGAELLGHAEHNRGVGQLRPGLDPAARWRPAFVSAPEALATWQYFIGASGLPGGPNGPLKENPPRPP